MATELVGSGEQIFLAECAAVYKRLEELRATTPNFTAVAREVWEQSRKLGRLLLRQWIEGDPLATGERKPLCKGCDKELRIQETNQRRSLQTMLGEVEYERAYCVCDRCGLTCVPVDEALKITESGPSVDALQAICHASVSARSFEDASETLRVQAGISLSRKHVRCLAEKEGQALVIERAQEVQRYQSGSSPPASREVPALLVIAADGGRIQTRQVNKEDRWKEDKVGVVYDADPHPQPNAARGEYEGAKAGAKTYVATMEPWEAMGWMLRLEAERRGYALAGARLFVSDGAKTIREMKELHFPEAVFILDWAHATEHLSACAKAAFGDGTSRAHAWYEHMRDSLWEGDRDRILKELDRLSRQAGSPQDEEPDNSPRIILDRNAHSYFPNNKEAMNYPLFRSKGWPIGSGVAEGAVKQFAIRLKGSEKFWNVSDTGAEEMLALCALYRSEDERWERYWQRRAQSPQQPP